MGEFEDFLEKAEFGNSKNNYPAKKKKKDSSNEPIREKKDHRRVIYTSDTSVVYVPPVKKENEEAINEVQTLGHLPQNENIEQSKEYNQILSRINNYVLVDFDIQLNIEKKEKKKFKSGTRSQFIRHIATFHADELRAKKFTEREIKRMKEDGVIANGYSVHHKFPRYFSEAMGIEHNNFKNLILVKEQGERGDEDIHAYMDKQLAKAIEKARCDRKIKPPVNNEISFGRFLEREGKTFKMTIPWPVGAVYLTPPQQKDFEKIKQNNQILNKKNILTMANEEIATVSKSYEQRFSGNLSNPDLKDARLSYEDSGKNIVLTRDLDPSLQRKLIYGARNTTRR